MTDLERYRRALERIRNYEPAVTNEWTQAAAFRMCQQIAEDVLDPDAKLERIAREREKSASLRKQVNTLRKQGRYWIHHSDGNGAWVRFLRGDPDQIGQVHVKILEKVGKNPGWFRVGEEIQCHVANLRTGPG